MTFNVFDNVLFGDATQFDITQQFSVTINEPSISVSDSNPTISTFTSVKIVFNSRIKPTEDVSI